MLDKNKKWIINDRKKIYQSKLFNLYSLDCFLPSKKINNDFLSLNMPDWVNVFAVTENQQVIMVRQHRLGKNLVTLEVPAGLVEKNEDPARAAARELEEETGFVTNNLKLLKKINVNPAIQDNTVYFYLATDCQKMKNTAFDSTEELEIALVNQEEIFKSRQNDLVENSVSLLSIMLAKDYLINDPV